jgi:hypothetical protein
MIILHKKTKNKKAYEKVNDSNNSGIDGYRECICANGKML